MRLRCSECGAVYGETIKKMFSPREDIIRNHGDQLECVRCGNVWDKHDKES